MESTFEYKPRVTLLATLVIGSAFPLEQFGEPDAFLGRWVLVAPRSAMEDVRNLRVEGYSLRVTDWTNQDALLLNPAGRIVRKWDSPDKKKLPDFVRDWLSGTSLSPGSLAPSPLTILGQTSSHWADVLAGAGMTRTQSSRGYLILFLNPSGPVDAIYQQRILSITQKCREVDLLVIGLLSPKSPFARYPFVTRVDPGNAYADAFRATVTPEAFLIDSQSRIVYTGAIDSSTWGDASATPYLLNAIHALASGNSVPTKQTMPFGTNIQR